MTPVAPGRAARPWLLFVLALAICGCQSGKHRKGRPGTAIESFSGALLVGGEYNRVKRDPGVDGEQAVLREELELAARGRIYDSRLLTFFGAVTLALNQADRSEEGLDFENLFLPRYRLSVAALPAHDVSGTLFASREENRSIMEGRATAPIVETIIERFGTRLNYRWKNLVGSFEWRRDRLATDGFTQDRKQETDIFQAEFRHNLGDWLRTRGSYSYVTFMEERSEQDSQTHTAWLFNSARLFSPGARDKLRFNTNLYYQERTGTTVFSTFRVNEDISWFLLPTLESRTRYNFSLHGDGSETESHVLGQRFKHWLYQSLITSVGGTYGRTRLGTGEITRSSIGIELDYRKKTALGPLHILYSHTRSLQENDLQGGNRQQIFDEQHVLSTTALVLLNNPNVDTTTVVITNVAGTVTYTEALDYNLIPRGNRTEVVRIPGGLIADGQTVLIDYEFLTPADSAFETVTDNFLGEITPLRGWRVYGRYVQSIQDLVRGQDAGGLEDRKTTVLGTEYQWKGVSLLGEYTDVDSTSGPYTQYRVTAGYSRRFNAVLNFGFNASDQHTDFPGNESQRISTFGFRAHATPLQRLSILLEPTYRIERGRGLDRNVLDLLFDVRYGVGKIDMRATARAKDFEGESSQSRTWLVTFFVRRRF